MSSSNQHFNDANGYESPLSHNNDYSNWNEDLVTSEIFSSSSSAISSPIMTNNECFAPLTSKILSSAFTTLKPIQPTFTKNIIPDTKLTSNCSSSLTSAGQISFSSSSVVEEAKKKTTVGRKRKAESVEEREQRQPQMSRDKKRKQMTDLESQNTVLKEENVHLSKRLKIVEEENSILSAKLDTILGQLAEIQSQLSISEMNKVLLDEVPAAARQVQEPLRDIITNPFAIQPSTTTELSDPIISTNTETSLVDLFDSFLDYDWGSEEFSSSVHQQQQSSNADIQVHQCCQQITYMEIIFIKHTQHYNEEAHKVHVNHVGSLSYLKLVEIVYSWIIVIMEEVNDASFKILPERAFLFGFNHLKRDFTSSLSIYLKAKPLYENLEFQMSCEYLDIGILDKTNPIEN
ncbi:12548_t:CDS:2 [Entrophospora sp. SA101]|nr:12548_t:CDS:2 [Entrophospora sp. SA101]